MKRIWGRQSRKRFRCPQHVRNDVCKRLLHDVWTIDWDEKSGGVPPAPYIDYWENLIVQSCKAELGQHSTEVEFGQRSTEVVGGLVKILRTGLDETVADLRDRIHNHFPNNVVTAPLGNDESEKALSFAIRLWIHINPDLRQQSFSGMTLRQVVELHVPLKTAHGSQINGRLSDDFCAKHLWRKGGINLIYVDDLNDHLTFDSAEQNLLVFRHSNMLHKILEDPSSDPFPPGFVEETLATLYLLFRPFQPRKAHYNVRQMEKHTTDLELAMTSTAKMIRGTSFELNDYRHWHGRLESVQKAFDRSKPATLRQWCYDRRDRVQWATFWVAFVVFVLTVIFGVIQCVTGILQVWVAYHPPQSKSL